MEETTATLGQLLYAVLWPDLPFSRVQKLKRFAETVSTLSLHPGRYTETRVQAINRGYALDSECSRLVHFGLLLPTEIPVLHAIMNQQTCLTLSENTFLPALRLFAGENQLQTWENRVRNRELIGCVAWSEVGNGSNEELMETTARFDREIDGFVVNSNGVKGVKWGAGGLGKTASHALVWSRVLVEGKDWGTHGFIVQVRNLGTWEVEEGVEVGDIGPKFGCNYIDNGYLRLKNVIIPRSHLLSRFIQVTSTGSVTLLPGLQAAILQSKLTLRVHLISTIWYQLARCITISLRYSSIRTQFRTYAIDPIKERNVLNYQYQSYRLIPILSYVYAVNAGAGKVRKLMEIEGNKDVLEVITAGMKAVYTISAAEMIETCRQCCGGHGFSSFSGIPSIYCDFLSLLSLESDNSGLILHAAQGLMRVFTESQDKLEYLHQKVGKIEGSLSYNQTQTQAFRGLAAAMMQELAGKIEILKKSGLSDRKIWTSACQLDSFRLIKAFIFEFTHSSFQALISLQTNEAVKELLTTMGQVFSLHSLYTYRSDLLRRGLITTIQASDLYKVLLEAIAEGKRLREPLIAGFWFSDAELNSALGVKSGEVYEKLLEWVKEFNPLNTGQPFEAVRYLKSKL